MTCLGIPTQVILAFHRLQRREKGLPEQGTFAHKLATIEKIAAKNAQPASSMRRLRQTAKMEGALVSAAFAVYKQQKQQFTAESNAAAPAEAALQPVDENAVALAPPARSPRHAPADARKSPAFPGIKVAVPSAFGNFGNSRAVLHALSERKPALAGLLQSAGGPPPREEMRGDLYVYVRQAGDLPGDVRKVSPF